MSRRIIRYRSPRARRLNSQAHVVLVASGLLFTLTVAAWAGNAETMTSFHWIMAAVNAAFALLSLMLYRIAALKGRNAATGKADLVDMSARPIPAWTPTPTVVEPVFRLPAIPKPPAKPLPASAVPAQPVARPVPTPARSIPAAPIEPVIAPVAPAVVHQDAELAAQQ